MKSVKSDLLYLVKGFFLLLSALLPIELFYFEKDAIQGSSDIGFKTYSLFWVLLVFFLLIFILKKFNVKPMNFFTSLIVSFFVYLVISLISVFIFKKDYVLNFIKKDYSGYYIRHYELDRDGDESPSTKDKKYLLSNVKKNESNFDYQDYSKETFLFWQTGVAARYSPKFLELDNNLKDNRVRVFLTIGPIMILESIINLLEPILLIMIVLIVGLFFRTHLFEDFVLRLFRQDV